MDMTAWQALASSLNQLALVSLVACFGTVAHAITLSSRPARRV